MLLDISVVCWVIPAISLWLWFKCLLVALTSRSVFGVFSYSSRFKVSAAALIVCSHSRLRYVWIREQKSSCSSGLVCTYARDELIFAPSIYPVVKLNLFKNVGLLLGLLQQGEISGSESATSSSLYCILIFLKHF